MRKKQPIIVEGEFGDVPLLVTTTDWFYGHDGNAYQGAWGRCRFLSAKKLIGFDPAHSANWLLEFTNGLIIQGCRIHYTVPAPTRPTSKNIYDANGR